jgi:NAD(P)-dependent dehydrogenase (short-subunit alcohol dehydrogenase family)
MAGRVSGKVALITGGGSGIGRATAIAFAREGAKISIADYNRTGGEETVRMIKSAGGEASFIEANVAIAKQVEAMVARTVETYGRLDCAFNNAGIEGEMSGGNIAECSEENWGRIIAINLTGVFLCMKYEIPQMLKHGGGSIVNTASAAGLIGLPGGTAYVASKHGVAGLTKSAALEYAKSGIRINAVCPGFIRTAMTERVMDGGSISEEAMVAAEPIGRIGKPEEIANVVLFLCSDDASFVTGLPMPVDGGYVAQ